MINAEFKDTFGNAVTIGIAGTTPAIREAQPNPFIIKDCSITYNDSSLKPSVNDYKGSITFVGSFNDYLAFGSIGHKTHAVTVTSAGLTFRGFLLPEVYDMEYTGHSVPFTLNFESILGQLERAVFDEPTGLYSIEDIINTIVSITGCTADRSLSFSESFSTLKVYSANFINDDNNKENYMKILEWIACTFGLKITLWGTLLTLYSCEKMQDVNNPYPSQHYGIDETVSVNELCDTCSVQVNNYELPDIPDDFSLQGARKLLDQKPMKIRRGKQRGWSKAGNYNEYYRQIYEYQPNQKQWHFNKYDANNNLVDEFDESKYIINGVPLAGAYPIAWGKITTSGIFSGMEQAVWFKRNNGIYDINQANAQRMISCHIENFLSKPNTFLFFQFEAAWIKGIGDVNSWDRGWNTDYDAVNDATYSSNFDECAVAIDPSIDDGTNSALLSMSVQFTDVSGTVYYWYPYGDNPRWTTTQSLKNFDIGTNSVAEFKFGSIPQNYMVSPLLNDGSIAIFEETLPQGVWVRLPETMGVLDISFGLPDAYGFIKSILFRGLNIDMIVAKNSVEEIDLSKNSDVVYSNTDNETTDTNETFYMYSENEYFGRGQLYSNDANTRVDTLTYPYGADKPEWNYIAIMTQLYSRAQVNNDIISINDYHLLYSDRYVNGASIDFLTGFVRVSAVKPRSYTLSKVI